MSEKNNLKIDVGANFEILRLKNARATDAAKVLDEAFNDADTRTNRIRVVVDPATNLLLVRAKPLDMLRIRDLVEKYIDVREINESDVIKTHKIGPLKHVKAKDVYLLIKDVYRELLNNQFDLVGKGALRNSFLYGIRSVNTDQSGKPRGGDLSVSYDDQTKTVYVNCNQNLYEEIDKLVKFSDKDAEKAQLLAR
jgi:hypothetical protein